MHWLYCEEKEESIEKQVLDLNLQGARWRERPKQTSKRTFLEEAGNCGKTWSEVKRLRATESEADASQIFCF